MGQTANVCSLCGSVAHSSNFCPMLASGKSQSVNTYRGPPGRPNQTPTSTDIQGRPRVSVGQREVCNNFNSDRGCPRRDCKFLHSCLKCRAPHANCQKLCVSNIQHNIWTQNAMKNPQQLSVVTASTSNNYD